MLASLTDPMRELEELKLTRSGLGRSASVFVESDSRPANALAPTHRRWLWFGFVITIGLTGVAVTYAVTRSDQPEVDADVLPVVDTASQAASFVDCSKTNSLAYFSDNPCETFLLLRSNHFGSAAKLLAAETRRLAVASWGHSAPQEVDYDGGADGMAALGESWVSPDHHACAYVTTVGRGVAAERREIFPWDPYNWPHGVLDFYRHASAIKNQPALWVRLRPPNHGGHCVG